MSVVAALYDVHGNLPALEAVLADAAFARADTVVVGGDVASGPMPAEALDRLVALELPVRWVRGNADREVVDCFDRGDTDPSVHPADDPAARADAATVARITAAHRDLLASFEDVVVIDGALYCHGSPRRDDEIITALTPEARLEPMLAGVDEALVVCGHTHHQFELRAGGRRIVNAGSVGMPYQGEAAAFWLLVADGEPEPRRTDYDVDTAMVRIRATAFPDADDVMRKSLLEPGDPAWIARFLEDRAHSVSES
ncbi:MAG: metallophosphoesterase family protein [Solirubrobacteraceae bacterium]